jgi:hypothetical protein
MILCLRTVRVPSEVRERFLGWIMENREVRQEHGILFELVLERSPRQNPTKTLQAPGTPEYVEDEGLVLTAWASHGAFDAWIETPDRDRLTASDVHGAVRYGPITRHDVAGGYLNIEALTAIAESPREEQP